uniref:Kaptin n=1 Tax=Syphacia muris TaxID=451379 RepID=A0A0N5AKF9_9BILA
MCNCIEKLPEQSLELKVDLRPTCIILVKSPDNICYLVTGDSNGSICFYLNGTRVIRYACPSACYDKAVTALTYGNFLNKDDDEENLVVVHADGYLQAVTLPKTDCQGLSISKPPTEAFFDLLDVNICNATICDIDCDSKNELVAIFVNGSACVIHTFQEDTLDIIVRLYRFEIEEGLKEIQVIEKGVLRNRVASDRFGDSTRIETDAAVKMINETSLDSLDTAHSLSSNGNHDAACNFRFDGDENKKCSKKRTPVRCKQSYMFPYLCSKLGTFPVLLTVLEGTEDDQLLVGVVSIDKRIHLYRYKFE